MLNLGKCINMFVVLDELTNIKASIKNDHSAFKKSMTHLKKLQSDKKLSEKVAKNSMFLANKVSFAKILSESKIDIRVCSFSATGSNPRYSSWRPPKDQRI